MKRSGCFFLMMGMLLMLAVSAHGADRAAGSREYHLTSDGKIRDYFVHLPPAYHSAGKPLPVVVGLHGGGGTAKNFEGYGLDPYADKTGMIMVYPEGVSSFMGGFRTWNAGKCCSKAMEENSDDVGFISAVIDAVVRDFHADARHVFVTGHSNGAMMAWRLACDIPDKIAAIAPVSGQSAVTKPCKQGKPVAVFQVHGTEAHCALYHGGPACGGCFGRVFGAMGLPDHQKGRWACRPVPDVLAKQAAWNGCGIGTDIVSENGPVTCKRWQGCPAGGSVTLCTVNGGGHHWQGSPLLGACQKRPNGRLCKAWEEEVGPVVDGVDTSAMIFRFFQSQANIP